MKTFLFPLSLRRPLGPCLGGLLAAVLWSACGTATCPSGTIQQGSVCTRTSAMSANDGSGVSQTGANDPNRAVGGGSAAGAGVTSQGTGTAPGAAAAPGTAGANSGASSNAPNGSTPLLGTAGAAAMSQGTGTTAGAAAAPGTASANNGANGSVPNGSTPPLGTAGAAAMSQSTGTTAGAAAAPGTASANGGNGSVPNGSTPPLGTAGAAAATPKGVCTNGEHRDCPGGKDTGECSVGTQTCVSGQWASCTGNVGPSAEICDGKDSNCNGVSDDAEPNLCPGGKPCLQSGCAKCTASTVAQDCPGASACKKASCTATGQCKLDDAPELTLCPGKETHEAYCMSGSCASPPNADRKTSMAPGQALYPGGMLRSQGQKFELEYQSDGNVTLWAASRKDGGDFVWCLFNTSKPTSGGALVMQPDGNLVLWANNGALWQSFTGQQPENQLRVTVTDTGHVYIKNKNDSIVSDVVGDYKGNVPAQ
jgi:hypothetical protein